MALLVRHSSTTDTVSHCLHSAVLGEDYNTSSLTILIATGGPTEACANVAIIDDTSLEGFHNFSVGVESTSLDTTAVSVPSAELLMIQLEDDECETQNCYVRIIRYTSNSCYSEAT